MITRQRRQWLLIVLAALASATLVVAETSEAPDVLLQRAIQKQMVDGDLTGAIDLYKSVIATPGVSARVSATALLHMGVSYERLDAAEARRIYERLLRDYDTQLATAEEARRRLTVLAQGRSSSGIANRLICASCGSEDGPISADGRLMVYTDWETGDIAARDLTSGKVTRMMLPNRSGSESEIAYGASPVPSPNGRLVVYTWFSGLRGSRYQLRTAERQGTGKPTVLIDDPRFEYLEASAWSPDAAYVLVTMRKQDKTWDLAWVSLADRTLKAITSLGWRVQGGRASLSPDGRFIAYSALAENPARISFQLSNPRHPREMAARLESGLGVTDVVEDSADRHIFVLAANGTGTETLLIKGPGRNESPLWAPNGKHVLFISNRYGSDSLWSVAVQGGRAVGAPTLVRRDIGAIAPLGFSRSGAFYYSQRHAAYEEIFITEMRPGDVGAAGSKSPDATLGGQHPSWSPDGKLISFARRRPGVGERYDIVVRNIETGQEIPHSHEGYRAGYGQQWIDNGSFLAWGGVAEGGPKVGPNVRVLYRVNAESRNWQSLMALDTSGLPPAWGTSPDLTTLYKGAHDPAGPLNSLPRTANGRPLDRILVLDVKTGEQKQALNLPEPAYSFQLSPDGRTFMLLSQTEPGKAQYHLSRMSVDGSGYRKLTDSLPRVPYGKWTRDGRSFVFAAADGATPTDASRLMRIPAEGGKAEFVGRTIAGLEGFDLSPDNSRVAFSILNRPRVEVSAIDNINSLVNVSR